MSKNRFLQLKEQNVKPKENNRFHFLLDDEDYDNNENNKSNKKKIEYEPSKNSFTQQRPNTNQNDLNYEKRRYDTRERYTRERDTRDERKTKLKRDNRFNTKITAEVIPKIKKLNFNDNELFPELIKRENANTNANTNTNTNANANTNIEQIQFKDILNESNVDLETNNKMSNELPPGWVQMTMNNRNILIKNSPLTPYLNEIKKQEELENDINHNMSKIIEILQKKYEENEKMYDSINGEGSYCEKVKMVPIYGPEYDTESESEYSEDNDSDSDYNNQYDKYDYK